MLAKNSYLHSITKDQFGESQPSHGSHVGNPQEIKIVTIIMSLDGHGDLEQ